MKKFSRPDHLNEENEVVVGGSFSFLSFCPYRSTYVASSATCKNSAQENLQCDTTS